MLAAKLTNEYYEVLTADAGRVALKAVEENAPVVTGSSRRRRRRLGMPSRPGPDRRHEKTPIGGEYLLLKFQDRYLILASLNRTCLRTTGSYLRFSIFSVRLRGFFLVT